MLSPPQQYVTVAQLSELIPTLTLVSVMVSCFAMAGLIVLSRLPAAVRGFFRYRRKRLDREKAVLEWEVLHARKRRDEHMHDLRNSGFLDDSEIPY